MTEIFCAVIAGAFAVLVAFIEARCSRDRKRTEKRADRRAEENRLAMELMSANCKLSLITAKAVLNQKVNGDVEEAFGAVRDAQGKYDSYITRLAAEQVAKA